MDCLKYNEIWVTGLKIHSIKVAFSQFILNFLPCFVAWKIYMKFRRIKKGVWNTMKTDFFFSNRTLSSSNSRKTLFLNRKTSYSSCTKCLSLLIKKIFIAENINSNRIEKKMHVRESNIHRKDLKLKIIY